MVVLGVVAAFAPMSWKLELVVRSLELALCGHMIFASPWTFWRSWGEKAALQAAATLLVVVSGYPSLREALHEARETAEYGEPAPVAGAESAMPADLVVSGVEISPPGQAAAVTLNVTIQNGGHTPAAEVQYVGKLIATKAPLDASEEDQAFASLRRGPSNAAPPLIEYGTLTLRFGENAGPGAITQQRLAEYESDGRKLYLLVILKFTNKSDNRPFTTEYCQYTDLTRDESWRSSPATLCLGHNTTNEAPAS